MDLLPNQFKRAIRSGQQQIGLWCSLASHISAEMLSGSGFDWLLLDTEHSPNEIPMVFSQLQAVASGGPAHLAVRADRRGSDAGGRGNPLSAARHTWLCLG